MVGPSRRNLTCPSASRPIGQAPPDRVDHEDVDATRASGRRQATYAGIRLSTTRRLAMNGWAAGIVIACLLMIPTPPTAQLGGAGWIAGVGIQVLGLAGWLTLRTHPERCGFGALLLITWLLPLDLAAMQWLSGGWSAPYHELFLPALILGSARAPAAAVRGVRRPR